MPEPSDIQDQPQPDAPVDTSTPEPDLTDELSAARSEEQTPETPPVDDTPSTDTPEADTPSDQPDTPADAPESPQPSDDPAPADTDDQPVTDLKSMTKEERKQYFLDLEQQRSVQDRADVSRKLDEHYQPDQHDDLKNQYLEAGHTDFEAEMLADRDRRDQALQLEQAKTKIIELNSRINNEALKVMHDFPVFDPDSPQYDKAFADRAAAMYQQAAGTVIDESSGVVLRTNLTPYAFYKDISDLRDTGLSQAQIKAQQNAERQLASVSPPSSAVAPPPESMDADDKLAAGLEAAFKRR